MGGVENLLTVQVCISTGESGCLLYLIIITITVNSCYIYCYIYIYAISAKPFNPLQYPNVNTMKSTNKYLVNLTNLVIRHSLMANCSR